MTVGLSDLIVCIILYSSVFVFSFLTMYRFLFHLLLNRWQIYSQHNLQKNIYYILEGVRLTISPPFLVRFGVYTSFESVDFLLCFFLLFCFFVSNNRMLEINKEIPEERVKMFKVNIKDTRAIIWCRYWKCWKYFVANFIDPFVDIVQVNCKMDCLFKFMKVTLFTSWYANVNVPINGQQFLSLQKTI